VLAAEGDLAAAERELDLAEHLFADEVATLHHAWVLVLLARVRLRRGRLDAAGTTLHAARESLGELADSGAVAALAEEVQRELDTAQARASSGELLEQPSAAELGVLRLLASDLSTREIAERLFLSPHTIRSHRRTLYHKLGVHTRTEAVARATALGLLEQTESPR
jgi:LuxR family maltose regulon positive regulatory protein